MKKWTILLLMLSAPTLAMAQGYPRFYPSVAAAQQVKTSGGYMNWIYCGALAGAAWLQVFDSSTAPTLGTTAPSASFPMAANQPLAPVLGTPGLRFSKGLFIALTTTANGATTAGPTPCSVGIQ